MLRILIPTCLWNYDLLLLICLLKSIFVQDVFPGFLYTRMGEKEYQRNRNKSDFGICHFIVSSVFVISNLQNLIPRIYD